MLAEEERAEEVQKRIVRMKTKRRRQRTLRRREEGILWGREKRGEVWIAVSVGVSLCSSVEVVRKVRGQLTRGSVVPAHLFVVFFVIFLLK